MKRFFKTVKQILYITTTINYAQWRCNCLRWKVKTPPKIYFKLEACKWKTAKNIVEKTKNIVVAERNEELLELLLGIADTDPSSYIRYTAKKRTSLGKSAEILPISGCVRMDCDNLLHDDKSVASYNKPDLNRLVATCWNWQSRSS